MDPVRIERLVAGIYDAAVDGRLWDAALVDLGKLTGSMLMSIEIYDADSEGVRGHNPMMAPEYREPYLRYWQHHFSLRGRTLRFPVGRVILPSEIIDFESGSKTAFYNDWVRPQGCGLGGRYANLYMGDGTTAILAARKPFRTSEFTREEEHLFEIAVDHFVRAVAIHRRLRLAEAQRTAAAAGAAPAGFLIVDRHGTVLAAHEETRQRLISAGLVSSHGELGSIRLDDPALRKMVACAPAAHGSGMPVGGQVKYRGTDGVVLNLAMIPITERGGGEAPWLPISEPAGLLFVTAPEDLAKERVRRLADSYGLTAAEAAVSVEIAKGDGRAAVAARLGIRETTVRSHLSAIFDKLGIHRQAELTRLVSGG